MAVKDISKYSQAVFGQFNPNATQRINWGNIGGAVGGNSKTYATSYFTIEEIPTHYKTETKKDKNGKKVTTKTPDKWKTVYNHPWILASSDFHMEIPSNAEIHKLEFEVKMRVSKDVTVDAPVGNFRTSNELFHHGYEEVDSKTTTGWNHGTYYYVPNKKLTSKFDTYTYKMEASDVAKGKHTPDGINHNKMGLDLIFKDATKITSSKDKNGKKTASIDVAWIRLKVYYYVPEYHVKMGSAVDFAINRTGRSIEKTGTRDNPYRMETDVAYDMEVHLTNKSVAGYGVKNVPIKITFQEGTELVKATPSRGTFDKKSMTWTVDSKANCDDVLYLKVKSHYSRISWMSAKCDYGTSSYCIFPYRAFNGYGTISLQPLGEFHKLHDCCLSTTIRGEDGDGTVELVFINGTITDSTNINSSSNVTDSMPMHSFRFCLDEEHSSEGVSIIEQTELTNTVKLRVPQDEEYVATVNYCFKPLRTGSMSVTVTESKDKIKATGSYTVLDPYTYVMKVGDRGNDGNGNYIVSTDFNDVMYLYNHRAVTTLDTGSSVVPCVADETDGNMIVTPCTLSMNVWEDLDYIGCVPLEHLHFDPKSTYKDTLLNSTYKNKRYMGKKLAVDEDITLNVRLHPQQVPVVQGLIEMDKPIPINANHKCFESDPLNHRGWAEIYSIKSEKTNEHWYKCDIDVKYLTHNLNSRFYIERSKEASDYEIPELMAQTWNSGENLSEDQYTGYFRTVTDGIFYYLADEDTEDSYIAYNDDERNNFSLDNNQYVTVTTSNPLSAYSEIDFNWSSVWLEEIRENAVSRIVRLYDGDKTVFEYQYDNIELDDDEITVTPIYRVWNGKELEDYQGDTISLRTDTSDDGVITYGSTIKLTYNNGRIEIVDMGFNGRESSKSFSIDVGSYYYQVDWKNNNSDDETEELDCTFDFECFETILSTTYSDKYGKLIVSPFPVPDKKIVFTREAQEGTLYYYHDDGEEFSFLVEPYYQYLNGTDLVTVDGISRFNLNYGDEVVYIQNGLVRLGFNRLTGALYLGKYDTQSESYITTHRLQLQKYDDINVNAISDDKIEIQASDSTFTIYRGHPYIKINHELEDIELVTDFNRVWAEKVGDDESLLEPAYWDLDNKWNLLPSCVCGASLKTSCLEVSEPYNNDNMGSPSLSWVDIQSNYEVGDIIFEVSSNGKIESYTDEIDFSNGECSFGSYTVDIESDGEPTSILLTVPSVLQKGETVPFIANVYDSTYKGVGGRTVYFYDEYSARVGFSVSKDIIQKGESSVLTAKVTDRDDGSLVEGAVVDFYEVIEGEPVSSITLTSDKSILSKEDGDEAVLTATCLDSSGSGVSGESVVFKNGSTVLATVSTDSSGNASYTYSSQGVGDVTLSVECGSLSQTVQLEDCRDYDPLTSDSGKWTIPSSASVSYSNDGMRLSASSYSQVKLTEKLTSACSVEFTLIDYSTPSVSTPPVIIFQYTNGETTPNQLILANTNSSSINVLGTTLNRSLIKGAEYRIEYTASTISVYENNELLGSASNNVGLPTRFEFHQGSDGRYAVYKDLKIKPL